ncbi:MAG: hypothetical protein ACLVEE_20475, partial [Phocaeicola vulgatus]
KVNPILLLSTLHGTYVQRQRYFLKRSSRFQKDGELFKKIGELDFLKNVLIFATAGTSDFRHIP